MSRYDFYRSGCYSIKNMNRGPVLDYKAAGGLRESNPSTWTKAFGTNWTMSQTTTRGEYLTSIGGAKFVSTASGQYLGVQKDFGAGTEFDLTGKFVRIRYYVSAQMVSASPDFYIAFNNGTTWSTTTDRLRYDLPKKAAGWHTIDIPLAQFRNTGFNHTAKARICTIYLGFGAGTATTWFLDSIEFIPTGLTKGKIIIGFDDGYISTLTGGISYLAKYGFPSMFYITGRAMGTTNLCTWAEVKEAERLGSMICVHDQPATAINAMSDSQLREWCETVKKPLLDNQFYQGAEYMAIPGGTISCASSAQIRIMREYFAHIRGVERYYQSLPQASAVDLGGAQPSISRYPVEPWWCGGQTFSTGRVNELTPAWVNSTSYSIGAEIYHTVNGVLCYFNADLSSTGVEPGVTAGWESKWRATDRISTYGKTYLDRIESEKEIGIVFFHGFNNEIAGSMTAVEFQGWVDYLATKNVDVVTLDDLLAGRL